MNKISIFRKSVYWGCAGFLLCACVCFFLLTLQAFSTVAQSTGAAVSLAENPIVILDAGHGGEDGGTVAGNGVPEKDINFAITQKTAAFLKLQGFQVVFTRETDAFIGDTTLDTIAERKRSDMYARLARMKEYPNGIFVSIHQNAFHDPKYQGAQVFYSANREESQTIAQCLQEKLAAQVQPENDRVCKAADSHIFLLKNATMPAVLVECGFLSNPEEAALLQQERYQNQIAFAIFSGILEYYSSR